MSGERLGELVIVTGMTGAGRSTAAKELEDLGYYVVDNLPPSLLPQVIALVDEIAQVPGIGPRTAHAIKDAVTRTTGHTGAETVNTATGEIT